MSWINIKIKNDKSLGQCGAFGVRLPTECKWNAIQTFRSFHRSFLSLACARSASFGWKLMRWFVDAVDAVNHSHFVAPKKWSRKFSSVLWFHWEAKAVSLLVCSVRPAKSHLGIDDLPDRSRFGANANSAKFRRRSASRRRRIKIH